MKICLLVICIVILNISCEGEEKRSINLVNSKNELIAAISDAGPGDEIVMKNGIWKDIQIKFYGHGLEGKPIVLRAETPGEVYIEGQSFLHLGGEYLAVNGLFFRNGYSPQDGIIRYKINNDSIAFNVQVSNCVITDFSRPNRWENDRWIEFYGKYNQLDHCYVSGKANDGETLRVFFTGNEHINNHHQIIHNYFGPRPRKGGPRAETIRVGDSKTRQAPGYVNVSDNYFEACNGEVEIISDKTNFNSFTKNIFYKSEGSLVLRHGNYARVSANMFIGGDDSNFYGGIRAVNTGHWITSNYFYKINGEEFRSPLAIMNGIPMTPLNRYLQVADVVVAYNTWVDCKSPWQIGVGQNIASSDVLPLSEIRSAPPIRTTIANNLIYNTKADKSPVVNHDDMSGIHFRNNIIDNNGVEYSEFDILENQRIKIRQVNDWLFVPENTGNEFLDDVFIGYDFDRIKEDLFGDSRKNIERVGSMLKLENAEKFKIDKDKYGPVWYSTEILDQEKKILTVTSSDELRSSIKEANSGDIIELFNGSYFVDTSLTIDKEITIRTKGDTKMELIYSGKESTPLFEMNPKGSLRLENIIVKGKKSQLTFAPLSENMSSSYKLSIRNCSIENFGHVLKASRGSFADSIYFSKSMIRNCENGFVLAADEKGDYNAEMVTFDNCEFKGIKKNLIHFYRGGYDESTIGGFLTLTHNTFSNCGSKEESGVLIKTPGIINVSISGNTFENNPVKIIAMLWGEKNNEHLNNSIENSGQIKIEAQQKLEILY